MSHLTLEALARLVDEAPGPDEEAHVATCTECRDHLEELREQTEALRALPKMMPPPDAWSDIRGRLREESLVRRRERPTISPAVWRAAAAVVLFVAGGATGYAARGSAVAEAGTPPVGEVETARGGRDLAADPAGPAGGTAPSESQPRNVAEAVEQAQDQFQLALDDYMSATASQPMDPGARLAMFDNLLLTTQEALNAAPADPLINSYYMTISAQRRALIRQINATTRDPVF